MVRLSVSSIKNVPILFCFGSLFERSPNKSKVNERFRPQKSDNDEISLNLHTIQKRDSIFKKKRRSTNNILSN